MSRTFRCRHGYVWWKTNRPDQEKSWSQEDLVYKTESGWTWKGNKPNGSDGTWNNTGPRGRLKENTNFLRRSFEKSFLVRVRKGIDPDGLPTPNEKQTKHLWRCYF